MPPFLCIRPSAIREVKVVTAPRDVVDPRTTSVAHRQAQTEIAAKRMRPVDLSPRLRFADPASCSRITHECKGWRLRGLADTVASDHQRLNVAVSARRPFVMEDYPDSGYCRQINLTYKHVCVVPDHARICLLVGESVHEIDAGVGNDLLTQSPFAIRNRGVLDVQAVTSNESRRRRTRQNSFADRFRRCHGLGIRCADCCGELSNCGPILIA
jgi:hypothetical protein